MAKPIFIVRLPANAPFEMANNVKEKTGRNLGDEYNVLVLIDMARKSKEIKFECYNADYSDMEWLKLEERVNAILKQKQHPKIQLKLYGSHTTYINTYIRLDMLEIDTIGLTWQPTSVIINGKEYPAPQVINLFEWNVRNIIVDLLNNKTK